ncbi:MAG: V-type ATP synthase subunit F [Gammaproteobacteria bacterium]|jgi:vacuolar-type H+-ATPase subunit F/Vma7|nr:V-type ATP synthase subunit F [Gammaproteobacteria bacterium]
MRAPVFIGDEVTAAGFRLAGAETWAVEAGNEEAQLRRAAESADLVLVTAAFAAKVPEATVRRLLAAPRPLLAVVEDARGEVPLPNVAARLRKQVGVGE